MSSITDIKPVAAFENSTKMMTLDDVERVAIHYHASGLFGYKSPSDAVSLMMLADSMGINPAKAATMYHIINGKPSMKAETMLALFQESGGRVTWEEYNDTCVKGWFSHAKSGQTKPLCFEWTIEKASKIMVSQKDWSTKPPRTIETPLIEKDTWKNYRAAMLRSRVISEAVRTIYPAVLFGLYTDEEVASIRSDETRFEKAKPVNATVKPQATAKPKPQTTAKNSNEIIEGEVIHPRQAQPDTIPQELTEEQKIVLKFKEEALTIYNKANTATEKGESDIIELMKKDWYALCDRYLRQYDGFKIASATFKAVHTSLGLPIPKCIEAGVIEYSDGTVEYLDILLGRSKDKEEEI